MLILDVSWEEPINPNGVITSYEVTVAEADNSSNIVYTNYSLTVTSIHQTVMIQSFTNYTVTVAASTSAGQGEGMAINYMYEAGGQSVCMFHYSVVMYVHTCIIGIYLLSCARFAQLLSVA